MDLRHLAELVDGIEVAMFTTVARDGRLVSRPLRTQSIGEDGDLWFVTDRESHKSDEIEANPQVNVSYASPSANTYVSIAGSATLVFDKARLHEFWSPGLSVFYPEGEDDPRLCLLRVEMESVEYWDSPSGFLGSALYMAMAAITGDPGALSDNERVELGKKS